MNNFFQFQINLLNEKLISNLQKLHHQQYYINMSFLEYGNDITEPLLDSKARKPSKPFPKLLNKRNSLINVLSLDQSQQNLPSIIPDTQFVQPNQDPKIELMNSVFDLAQQQNLINRREFNSSQKKSVKVQFNKKRKQDPPISNQSTLESSKEKLKNKLSLNQSIYEKFELQGLRIKSNWQIPTKSKSKSFNMQIMSIDPGVQKFLYYMNLIFNTVFRLSLLAILVLMIVYQRQIILMQMVVSLQIVAAFLYCLAMIKMLYTKKDEESIYLQKHFTERDITDIEMDRVLRKHFTWRNILGNVSAYFKLNSKFKNDIKISLLRQEIFKRMEIVLCFIPFLVIFFFAPNVFKFQCDYPVELIVTATICMEFVRMTVHYIIIFIEN